MVGMVIQPAAEFIMTTSKFIKNNLARLDYAETGIAREYEGEKSGTPGRNSPGFALLTLVKLVLMWSC